MFGTGNTARGFSLSRLVSLTDEFWPGICFDAMAAAWPQRRDCELLSIASKALCVLQGPSSVSHNATSV